MHQHERIASALSDEIDALHLPIPMTQQAEVVLQLTAAVTRALGPSAMAQAAAEFHAALDQTFGDGGSSNELRARLHTEENTELCDELRADNRVGIAQELADVVYVAYGTAFSHGINLDAVLAEIHRANMTKLGPEGRFQLREDGKVLKGEHYQPPDIAAVAS